ncbi:MAG: ral secretion pathway protein [Proteobacteria bacterium]|nr:ral secretion pathway protein [Pseudomonadota bacterium]
MRRATDFRKSPHSERGFTLIEMIVVIVVSGVLLGIVGMFGRQQIDAYIDVANRAELADAADTALRRIGRDLQSALPNSVRQSGTTLIEFVPIRDAGRYRADVGSSASDDPLVFSSSSDSSFDVVGPSVSILSGDQLVVYNTGQAGSDVYAGTSRRSATVGSNLSKVTFAPAGTQFPIASPQNRFQIVGGPVTYECVPNLATPEAGTVIRRWCYDFQSAQPTSFAALTTHAACTAVKSAVLVSNVAACSFNYTPAVMQRNGLIALRLRLTRNGESVELLHQIEVLNTP